jgi:hypothetical protein
MSDFNKEDFFKRVNENKAVLQSHVKSNQESKMNKEIINTINSWNAITTPIMCIVGVLLFSAWCFFG